MIEIGTENQIFIDGRFMAEHKNANIVVQQPRKTGEENIVSGTYRYVPYDQNSPTLEGENELWPFTQVMEYDGVFKGFDYVSGNGTDWVAASPELLDAGEFAYGLRLCEQPALKWQGKTGLSFGIVFRDPAAESSERYKLVSAWQNKAFATADGTEWRVIGSEMFPKSVWTPFPDAQNVVFYDDSIDEYVAFIRHWRHPGVPARHQAYFDRSEIHGKKNALRVVARLTSKDLVAFSEPQVVMEPDEHDPIMDGVAVMDFHSPAVMKYTAASDAYILYNHPFLHYQDWFVADDLSRYAIQGGVMNCGTMDIRTAASRDGIKWEQYDRQPVIRLDIKGGTDGPLLWPVYGMIFHEDEIWVYYIANPCQNILAKGLTFQSVMSRVVFRKDGFTGVEADYTGGEFTTPVLTYGGNELHLNVETSATGLVRVEIQDESGKPVPGFSLDECDRIHTTNSIKRAVSWRKGHSDIGNMIGRSVRLRFELRYGAKLYAFQTAPAERTHT